MWPISAAITPSRAAKHPLTVRRMLFVVSILGMSNAGTATRMASEMMFVMSMPKKSERLRESVPVA